MKTKTNTSTLTPKRTSPVRAGDTNQPVDVEVSSHKVESASCKNPLQAPKRLSGPAELEQAKRWVHWLVQDKARHRTDIEGAMHRLEAEHGIGWRVFGIGGTGLRKANRLIAKSTLRLPQP